MIRIAKPTAPEVLLTRGISATDALCTAHERGNELPEFNASIYAHETVKDALRHAQLEKCAFCESLITHISPGDVEHFRPKAGYRQHESDELRRPGYYWLAYTWANLFLACSICN